MSWVPSNFFGVGLTEASAPSQTQGFSDLSNFEPDWIVCVPIRLVGSVEIIGGVRTDIDCEAVLMPASLDARVAFREGFILFRLGSKGIEDHHRDSGLNQAS